MVIVKNIFQHELSVGEFSRGNSSTIPGQELTVRELIERFTAGIPNPEKQALWFDEDFTYPYDGDDDRFKSMTVKQQIDALNAQVAAQFSATKTASNGDNVSENAVKPERSDNSE